MFTISSGHGKYVSGASGYIDEVTEARRVVNRVSEILKEMGIKVNTYHENTAKNKTDNLNTIIKHHNSTSREKDVSIHFNAYQTTDKAMGVEVLYLSDGNKELASKVSKAIAEAGGFLNRGAKHRTNLGFLNKTNKGAILIEVCFVDSKKDTELYKANFEKICISIAESLSGKEYKNTNTTTTKTTYYRVIAGSYTDRTNAENMKNRLIELGIPSFLEAVTK